MKPLIGISSRVQDRENQILRFSYVNAVRKAGGVPVLIPVNPADNLEQYVDMLDGYLIPGGVDVTPLLYGEQPHPAVKWTFREIDMAEMAIVKGCMAQGKPLLGICRGHQVINVCLGGALYQDLPTQTKNVMCHYQDLSNRSEATHTVAIEKDSMLCGILGREEALVNTFHHQAVRVPGEGLRVVAAAPDGTIESVESADGMVQGIQWHPEEMYETSEDARKLFAAFVERCRLAKERRGQG